MPKFEHHIFICTNTRDAGHPRGSCNAGGNTQLPKLFNEQVKLQGLKTTVRSNKSGCIDQCEHGPNVVIYPEATWYGGVKESDVEEIVLAVKENRIVNRLVLKDSCINTATCEHRTKP